MGLTDDEATEVAWNANIAAVQDAKAAVNAAMRAYGTAGEAAARTVAPLRRKMFTGLLSDVEVDVVDAEEAKVEAARQAVDDAKAAVAAAQQQFKAGVTDAQIAAVQKEAGK